MKKLALFLSICFSVVCVNAQNLTPMPPQSVADSFQTVEVACGQCKFNLKGKSCDLAVRIKDKSYFVDGTKIDDHGDAHADDGLCNKVRKAKVSGSIVNDRFVATSFKLLPEEKIKP